MKSPIKCFLLFLWLFLSAVFYPPALVYGGEASINVLPTHTAYRDIEKLIAHKLIKTSIWGQRPYSRQELARLLLEAKSNFLKKADTSEKNSDHIQEILERLQFEFREEIEEQKLKLSHKVSLHPIANGTLQWTAADSPFRAVPNNGIGLEDALINPLLQSQTGKHLVEGSTASVETSSWMRFTNYSVFHFIPRVQLAFDNMSDAQADVFVENLYAKFFFKNIELEIGRDNVLWGQGENATLFLSANPRALDVVKISNDKPFLLPWVFKNLGLQKMSFIYADLGPEQNFSHPYLAAWKWSLLPFSFLELGLAMGVHSGGEGSPDGSFLERLSDVVPLTHFFAGSQQEIGNKIGGGDFNLKLPFLRNTSFYGEIFFDDLKGDTKTQFVDVAAYLFGMYVPRLLDSGLLDLRLEYHQLGQIFYRHGQFQSGWTMNQFILGDPLGPDSRGFYVTTNWDFKKNNLLETSLALETRSGDIYTGVYPVGANSTFPKVTDNPEETRYRITMMWAHQFQKYDFIKFSLKGGYERVKNFNFSTGSSLDNFFGQFTLNIQPAYH